MYTAAKPMAAANDNHSPGTARFPVVWISHVHIAGVKPPMSATVARRVTLPGVVRWIAESNRWKSEVADSMKLTTSGMAARSAPCEPVSVADFS